MSARRPRRVATGADGRFAPSPTGSLHLGNLHGAPGLALRALGLDWDGPIVRQSERHSLYDDAIERLRDAGLLYECWCTRVRTGFDDLLLGHHEGVVDDFVLRRNDGVHAYNLAVVVDDAAQGIGEVVRGADLLDSTPRQLWLADRLGLPPPRHAHVPIMRGPDGERLAKRHGAVTLADRRALGESPVQVRGALAASVGLAAEGEEPTLEQLLERFTPEALAA